MLKSNLTLLSCLIASSLTFYSCTSTKKTGATGANDPVATDASAAAKGSGEDLPEELKDALNYDPATSLDAKTVEESDFYQIKKSVEENKANLDAAWREQERMESSVKAAKQESEKQKALKAKQEEEERDKQRLKEIEEFEKNTERRAKEAKAAEDEISKLPTISKDEIMWQGIED
jgi:multimeric flavodoxin WrbA